MKKPSLLVVFLTVFIDLIGFGMVLPLLPIYSKDFGASGWMIGLIDQFADPLHRRAIRGHFIDDLEIEMRRAGKVAHFRQERRQGRIGKPLLHRIHALQQTQQRGGVARLAQ